MTWGKVDDKLHSSIKWRATPKPARALWATALSWCMDQLTDGFVPIGMLTALDGTRAEANALVRAGLWEDVDGGWLFHDWLEYQPSRETVLADRKAAAERQRRAREKAAASRRDSRVTHGEVTPPVTVPPTRPDPTRTSGVLSVVGELGQDQHVAVPIPRPRRSIGLGSDAQC